MEMRSNILGKTIWKKLTTIILILSLSVVSLCGCGVFKSALTVYIVETDALYRDAISAFQKESDVKLKVVSFESYDEMKDRMNTEVMRGKGPDVLLFNSRYDSSDIFKMSSSGNLLELDEYVTSLEEDTYFTAILEAGKTNGHQYFLPLSWNIVQAYSMQEKIVEKEYTDDLYSAFAMESDALKNDDTMAASATQIRRSDLLNYFLETAGIELIDSKSGALNDLKTETKQITDFVKVIYDDSEKVQEISTRYASDFSGAVAHFTYLTEEYSFMNNLRYYQTVYPQSVNDEMYFAPFKNVFGGVTAQVVEYGAINANTNKEKQAWELLNYIMDYTGSMDFSKYDEKEVYYAPINKEVFASYLKELATYSSHGPGYTVSPLEEEWVQVLEEIPSMINATLIPKVSTGALVQEYMNPYLAGEDSFDNCYDKLLVRLEMYLEE